MRVTLSFCWQGLLKTLRIKLWTTLLDAEESLRMGIGKDTGGQMGLWALI